MSLTPAVWSHWDFISYLMLCFLPAELMEVQQSWSCSLIPTSCSSMSVWLMVRRSHGTLLRILSNGIKCCYSIIDVMGLKSFVCAECFPADCVVPDYGERPLPPPLPPGSDSPYEPNLEDEYYWRSRVTTWSSAWRPSSPAVFTLNCHINYLFVVPTFDCNIKY